jgi:hypothetical protein
VIKINKIENRLHGSWFYNGDSVVEDGVSKRINLLIKDYLIKIATSQSGWKILYQDPEDKRYWELTYPDSESHGGGAPTLLNIREDEARQKFKFGNL